LDIYSIILFRYSASSIFAMDEPTSSFSIYNSAISNSISFKSSTLIVNFCSQSIKVFDLKLGLILRSI
jgi:hypothetical protein